jgi:hypothetical protein
MRASMSSRPAIGVIAFLCLETISWLCSAQMPQCSYPSNLSKTNPAAYSALTKIISPQFRTKDWIYKLEGTEDQVTTVSVGTGSPWYLYGSVCKPHDCGANNFSFLIEQRGSRAVALLVSEAEAPGKRIAMGSPTATELILLRAKISQW